MAPLSRPGPPGQGAAETNARGLRRRGKFEFIRCKCWRSSLLFVLMGQLAAGFEGGRNTVALHRVLADHERRLRSRVSPKVAKAILAVPGPAKPQGPAEATKPAAAAAKTEPLLQMVPADSTKPTEAAGDSAVPDAPAAEQSRGVKRHISTEHILSPDDRTPPLQSTSTRRHVGSPTWLRSLSAMQSPQFISTLDILGACTRSPLLGPRVEHIYKRAPVDTDQQPHISCRRIDQTHGQFMLRSRRRCGG